MLVREIDNFSFSLFAQTYADEAVISDEVTRSNNAPTLQVLIFQLVYVLVFIASFATFYRITKDKWLTTFGSASVLLIFGFISQTAFVAFLGNAS